jgi:hypothetical protein
MRAADNFVLRAGRGFLIAWQPTRNARHPASRRRNCQARLRIETQGSGRSGFRKKYSGAIGLIAPSE